MFACTLFDFNGVLVDDERVHLAAFQDTLAPLGITLGEADYWEKYLGFDDVGAFEAILRAHGQAADRARVDELVRAKFPIYMQRAEQNLEVFEGAADLVNRCAAFGAVGVVSGALRPEIELGLRVLGVRSHVGFIVAAEDTQASKPDPEGYLIGLAKLREGAPALEAKQVLVIEDSLSGIEAAKAAGLTCVAVAHSYPEPELRAAGADQVAAHVRDVDLALLERTAAQVGS